MPKLPTANNPQKGFTFIELLVVVSLTVVIMLSVTTLFMIFLISNSKTSTVQVVKNEGNAALQQMTFLLRNALRLEPNGVGQICDGDMEQITFESLDGRSTTFMLETDTEDNHTKIASNSGTYLTSSGVDIVANADGQPLFACQSSLDGRRRYVTVTFTLRKGTPGVDEARDIVEQRFKSGVLLRNY